MERLRHVLRDRRRVDDDRMRRYRSARALDRGPHCSRRKKTKREWRTANERCERLDTRGAAVQWMDPDARARSQQLRSVLRAAIARVIGKGEEVHLVAGGRERLQLVERTDLVALIGWKRDAVSDEEN